jgi:hypothetical protein
MAPQRLPSTTYNVQKSFSWVNGGLFSPFLSPHSPCPISTLRPAGAGRPPSSRSYSTMYPRSKPSSLNPHPERPNTDTSTSDNAPSPVPFLSTCPSTVIPLEIWDCPGNTTPDTLGASLADFSSIIFVIDIQVVYPSLMRPCHAHTPPFRTPINSLLLACSTSSLRHIRRTRVQRWRSSSTKQSHSRRITR